ncbi:MAG: 23S rRNA (pseudouridine(1915)-N(3))-methyltransferase RlmH [Flavitalea sp.]
MRIQCWSVGKPNEKFIEEGVAEFTKRVLNYFPIAWKIIPPLKNAASLSEDILKKKEGEVILKMLADSDCLITLDEKGRLFSSPQLATFIQSKANESTRELIFLIGGAYGIDADVIKRANQSWSLSALTFPHQLVRLILVEQLYRACSILRNERYHHN